MNDTQVKVALTVCTLLTAAGLVDIQEYAPAYQIINIAGMDIKGKGESVMALSRLHVTNTKIYNAALNEVQLKGVNFPYNHWWSKNRASSDQAKYMAGWGCNVCQITFNRYDEWLSDATYRAKVDDIISWNAANGIYTVLLNQDNGAYYDWSTLTAADWTSWRSVWTDVATRYSGSTNVIYNLIDEPTGLTHEKYRDEMRTTIDAIRAIDPDMLIVVQALYGSADSWLEFSFETDYPLVRTNILYDGHSFMLNSSSWWVENHTKSDIRDWLTSREWKWMKDNSRAVWCGSFNYNNTVSVGSTWFQNWIDVLDDDGYNGYATWSWSTSPWNGMELLSDWSGTPTEAGKILIQNLIEYPRAFGLSGYPRTLAGAYSTDIIDNVIAGLDNEGLDTYRMSIYITESTTTAINMATYFLTNCDYNLILDLNHLYPPGDASAGQWTTMQTRITTVLAALGATYPYRLAIEICNERSDSDLATQLQTIVTAVRAAGYVNPLIANKWDQSWSSMATISDPYASFFTGYHYYFTSGAWTTAESQMQTALDLDLRLINTEIGADYNEKNSFDGYEVARVSEFMQWCYENGIGCQVWMNRGLDNYLKYVQLGLEWPPKGATPEEPEPPIDPPPIQYYYVNISADSHGSTTPSGTVPPIPVGQTFPMVATPDTDYLFSYWTRNGVTVSTNPFYAITDGYTNSTYTMVAYFVANPPVEPDPPDVPDPEDYSVNIGSSTGVTTSLTGTQTLPLGQTLSVTATLKNNYRFNYWLYDNVAVQNGSLTFTVTETSTGQHTLLPVVQYISPPPQNQFILPSASNVAPFAPNKLLDKIMSKQATSMKPIDIKKLFKELGKINL